MQRATTCSGNRRLFMISEPSALPYISGLDLFHRPGESQTDDLTWCFPPAADAACMYGMYGMVGTCPLIGVSKRAVYEREGWWLVGGWVGE